MQGSSSPSVRVRPPHTDEDDAHAAQTSFASLRTPGRTPYSQHEAMMRDARHMQDAARCYATGGSTLRNSKRFQKFRNRLIREIPRIPNDRASLAALESKGNSELLRIYMCWKLRQVAIRPRRVTGQSALKADCRATSLQPNIEAFIRAVEVGADLNRYLSTKAHRHGYVLASDPEIADCRTWEDKDFLLNVLGRHHFHLGLHRDASGMMARTDEVLFGSASRDTIRILGLFDHSVFDWSVDDAMTPERERLWSFYDDCRRREPVPMRSCSMVLED